ncbi:MAG: DMT family transporter [Phycisphaerae bacterium]|jgi:drug/metabolite transporter (DMT)-like permease
MSEDQVGQSYALLAALTWACALVLFKQCGERIPPIALNLFKNAVALVLFAFTLAFLLAVDASHGLAALADFTLGDWCLLMLSGIIGIALADTVFFYALNLVGVGLVSIMDCAYSPMVILLSWLMLSEKLTPFHYVGTLLVLTGVFTASRHDPPRNRTRGQVFLGMFLAALAVSMMAFGIVLAKPVLNEFPVFWAAAARMAAGSLLLMLFALLGRSWKRNYAAFRPSTTWKYAVPASVLGTFLAMVFWVAGFKYTEASVAAVLNQTSVVFAVVLASVFLKEPFGLRKGVAVVLAMTGVVLVTFSNWLMTQYGDVLRPWTF